jgi:hypothetical protein
MDIISLVSDTTTSANIRPGGTIWNQYDKPRSDNNQNKANINSPESMYTSPLYTNHWNHCL